MNLYNYDKNTKEYLSTTLASADPMESKIRGEFVPLVPAYATLIEPPTTGENEVAIFNGKAWEIKKDFRVSHKICDENFNIKDITEIGEIEEKYLVTADMAKLIKENPNNFKIQNNEIVQKTETEIEEEKVQERQTQFSDNFIITSWGAFRKTPQGYSSAVEAVNTIFNMVNIAQGLNESLAPLLIFYEVPDFTDPKQCTEEWLVANQKTHEPCDIATFMQWYLEFQTIWAQTQYTSQQVPLSL